MNISQIQHLLAFLGYYKAGVDGLWGEGSKRACEAFQRDFGLSVDGIPGKDTQKALRHAVAFGLPEREDKPAGPQDEEALFWSKIKHFTPSEFTCPCCGMSNMDHRLVEICDDIREKAGVPFIISSGPRCPRHNAEVGGVATSRHLYGRAVDFRLKGKTADQTLPIVKADGRLAYYYKIDGDYVHMDIV